MVVYFYKKQLVHDFYLALAKFYSASESLLNLEKDVSNVFFRHWLKLTRKYFFFFYAFSANQFLFLLIKKLNWLIVRFAKNSRTGKFILSKNNSKEILVFNLSNLLTDWAHNLRCPILRILRSDAVDANRMWTDQLYSHVLTKGRHWYFANLAKGLHKLL